MEYKIDASEKVLGRIASEVAQILMGKNLPNFQRHELSGNKVHIINASKAKISIKKLESKEYKRYSGYPGGLKTSNMEKIIAKKGYSELFRKAVYGMLPSNKLRAVIMKNLTISE